LCRAYHCSFLPVTAHEDWTTFEVVGRQELRVGAEGSEQTIPVNGFFTEAVIRCAGAIVTHFDDPAEPQAVWLLIDELNRAHLDKAFGELFTVLGTDEPVTITLPHQRIGNCELVTPVRFRIVATLNSVDRQFVNSLSQGLKRRFTFVTVDVPPRRDKGEEFGDGASLAAREFRVVIERAISRVTRRLVSGSDEANAALKKQLDFAHGDAREYLILLFELAERTRYAAKNANVPYLPIGTAQLIDTVELFVSRSHAERAPVDRLGAILDWAASAKLAPLFDADTVNPAALDQFAGTLTDPFTNRFRRELRQIVAAGTYFVDQ
jgi:hypothetical protein